MAAPVALIIGAGSNIGAGVARAFAAGGYKIALASRHARPESTQDDYVHIQGDLANPGSAASIFSQVREKLGHPSVVVYNGKPTSTPGLAFQHLANSLKAAAFTPVDPKDPLALKEADLARDLQINTLSVLDAAHEATVSFGHLPSNASKTFIYTGNGLNILPAVPPMLSLGVGKSATAYIIASASKAYADQGYKFYYADERLADGSVAGRGINGEAHGKFYAELASRPAEVPWLATFVKDIGYKAFP